MTVDAAVAVSDRPTPSWSTEGRTIYAVGDVQGRYDLLATLLEVIVADISEQPAGTLPLLIFCGGYIDHGPDSASVLSALVWLVRHAPAEVRTLQGSNERALIDFMDRPETLPAWLRLGGAATLRAFGVDLPNSDNSPDHVLVATRDALADHLPASQLALLRAAPALTSCGDYVFAHAAQPCRARMLVHGSGDGADAPQMTNDRTGIDTTAYRTGVLTALRLDGTSTELLQTGGEIASAASVDARPPRQPEREPEPDCREVSTMREALARLRPEY